MFTTFYAVCGENPSDNGYTSRDLKDAIRSIKHLAMFDKVNSSDLACIDAKLCALCAEYASLKTDDALNVAYSEAVSYVQYTSFLLSNDCPVYTSLVMRHYGLIKEFLSILESSFDANVIYTVFFQPLSALCSKCSIDNIIFGDIDCDISNIVEIVQQCITTRTLDGWYDLLKQNVLNINFDNLDHVWAVHKL